VISRIEKKKREVNGLLQTYFLILRLL